MLLVFLLSIAIFILAIVSFKYLLPLVVKQLAAGDILLTLLPSPGKYKFLMKGGRLVAVLENVNLWRLDENNRFVRGEKERSLSEIWFGAIWMGVSPLYHIEKFTDRQWTELKMVGEGTQTPQYTVVARTEKVLTEFLFQFTVIIPVRDMELIGNIQADINVLLTVLILDPVKAFFTNKNWLEVMAGMVQSVVRGQATGLSFEQLKTLTQNSGPGSPFEQLLIRGINGIDLGPGNPNYQSANPNLLFGITGVAIWSASLQDLEATGDAAKALRAREIAILEGDAEITKAQKKAQVGVEEARGHFNAAELEAAAQRMVLEQTAGYLASLPDGGRMYVAHQIASPESDVTTWAEAGSEVRPALSLPPAPYPIVPRR